MCVVTGDAAGVVVSTSRTRVKLHAILSHHRQFTSELHIQWLRARVIIHICHKSFVYGIRH